MHGCPNSLETLMKYKLFKNIHFLKSATSQRQQLDCCHMEAVAQEVHVTKKPWRRCSNL